MAVVKRRVKITLKKRTDGYIRDLGQSDYRVDSPDW